MTSWPWVVVPAVVVALVVRVDARAVGPYFALSSLISGTEGMPARLWYEESPLRQALARRFAYPSIVGFLLGWSDLITADVVSVGLLAAGLLLWPMIFHGLPWFVPRRSWHLPVLYSSFVVAFGALAGVGLSVQRLVIEFSDGDTREWVLEQFVATAIFWVLALVGVALFRAVFARTRDEAMRRESTGAESIDGLDDM